MKRRQFLKHVGAATLATPFIPAISTNAATTSAPAARSFYSRLQPAVVGGGFELPDSWVWCGAPIRGEDGKYHLFASRVPTHLFCATAEGPGVDLKDATRTWNIVFPLRGL